MKKLSILFITLILTLALSACGNTANNNLTDSGANQQGNQSTAVTRDKALEIALEKAGVKQEDIRDLDIELDNERGTMIWEIDFDYGNLEYSYDVDAESGAITKVDRERDN